MNFHDRAGYMYMLYVAAQHLHLRFRLEGRRHGKFTCQVQNSGRIRCFERVERRRKSQLMGSEYEKSITWDVGLKNWIMKLPNVV